MRDSYTERLLQKHEKAGTLVSPLIVETLLTVALLSPVINCD